MSEIIFHADASDKATRTLEFLDVFKTHPKAAGRVCLHGGTALNLFVLEPKRLSLDADINFVGNASVEQLPAIRTELEAAIEDVAYELGYKSRAGKGGHAGRTFKLMYESNVTGATEFIKVDMDYLNRVPLLDPVILGSKLENPQMSFPINAPVEVVAGKLKALCERVVPRDLYDIGRIAETLSVWSTGNKSLDHAIMLFYFALSSSFPKPQNVLSRFDGRERDAEEILWPVLPSSERPALAELQEAARAFIEWATTPINENESEFLSNLSQGEYLPDLLFGKHDEILRNAAASPAMAWKLQNLRIGIEQGLIEGDK